MSEIIQFSLAFGISYFLIIVIGCWLGEREDG